MQHQSHPSPPGLGLRQMGGKCQTITYNVQTDDLVREGPVSNPPPSQSPTATACGTERRREPRVAVDVTCRALVGRTPRRYRLLDLSCGGALIEHGAHPPPDEVHTITLDDGTNCGLHVLARTVWKSDERHAVCFLALNEGDRLEVAEGFDRLIALSRRRKRRAS